MEYGGNKKRGRVGKRLGSYYRWSAGRLGAKPNYLPHAFRSRRSLRNGINGRSLRVRYVNDRNCRRRIANLK